MHPTPIFFRPKGGTTNCTTPPSWVPSPLRENGRKAVIDLQAHGTQGCAINPAAVPTPDGIGVPRAGQRALLELEIDQLGRNSRVPSLPAVTLELVHNERAVI